MQNNIMKKASLSPDIKTIKKVKIKKNIKNKLFNFCLQKKYNPVSINTIFEI